jgi:hypothetical protein
MNNCPLQLTREQPMPSTSPLSFIDTVQALAPQIEAAADENEQARRLSPSLAEAPFVVCIGGDLRWTPTVRQPEPLFKV